MVDPDLMKFQSQQKKSGRSGKGNKIYSMDRGRYVKAMLPKGGDAKSGKIALDATLRNAVVYQKMRREEAKKKLKPEVGALEIGERSSDRGAAERVYRAERHLGEEDGSKGSGDVPIVGFST